MLSFCYKCKHPNIREEKTIILSGLECSYVQENENLLFYLNLMCRYQHVL